MLASIFPLVDQDFARRAGNDGNASENKNSIERLIDANKNIAIRIYEQLRDELKINQEDQ